MFRAHRGGGPCFFCQTLRRSRTDAASSWPGRWSCNRGTIRPPLGASIKGRGGRRSRGNPEGVPLARFRCDNLSTARGVKRRVKEGLAGCGKRRKAAPLLGFVVLARPSKHNSQSLKTQYLVPQNTIVSPGARPSKHNSCPGRCEGLASLAAVPQNTIGGVGFSVTPGASAPGLDSARMAQG